MFMLIYRSYSLKHNPTRYIFGENYSFLYVLTDSMSPEKNTKARVKVHLG